MIQVRCICDISRLQDLLTVPESHMAKRIRNQGKKCVTLNKIYVTNPRLDILECDTVIEMRVALLYRMPWNTRRVEIVHGLTAFNQPARYIGSGSPKPSRLT